MTLPRLCIASTGGGAGKTIISLGLARAFLIQGISVQPFKKGPDFIDTFWLGQAAKCQAANLDPFFSPPAQIRQIFCSHMARLSETCLGLIEGNRGLFDGLNETGACSTAQIARILNCPIILCMDCHKATRTLAAIVKGLIEFEPDLVFSGLILNRAGSERHKTSLLKALAANCNLPVFGVLPRFEHNPLPERHMGLATRTAEPDAASEKMLDQLAQTIAAHCNLKAIYASALAAPVLECPGMHEPAISIQLSTAPRIGIVKDNALWFYYGENIKALEQAGAKIVYLSLFDTAAANSENWKHIDGLYLGGGFPEDYLPQISSSPFLQHIRHYALSLMPVYAECGGMILLAESFFINGNNWRLASAAPCRINWHPKPQGLGYVEGTVSAANPWYPVGLKIIGHEFHYSSCSWSDEEQPTLALTLSRGQGISKKNGKKMDGFVKGNTWASYLHIYAPALPLWAQRFVELAKIYRKIKANPGDQDSGI